MFLSFEQQSGARIFKIFASKDIFAEKKYFAKIGRIQCGGAPHDSKIEGLIPKKKRDLLSRYKFRKCFSNIDPKEKPDLFLQYEFRKSFSNIEGGRSNGFEFQETLRPSEARPGREGGWTKRRGLLSFWLYM